MQAKKASLKEIEDIEKIIEKNYGTKLDLSNYEVYINKRGEIFLASKSISIVENLIEKSSYFGLYIGKLKRNQKIQLSVEGSQIVGKQANKNIAILDDENIFKFMEGLPAKWKELINCEKNNFVLIKNNNDFFGSGILREDFIENYVPKGRRIMTSIKKI
jgi:NOL1/NOP2/fmu family ribosome biogenesis protein